MTIHPILDCYNDDATKQYNIAFDDEEGCFNIARMCRDGTREYIEVPGDAFIMAALTALNNMDLIANVPFQALKTLVADAFGTASITDMKPGQKGH